MIKQDFCLLLSLTILLIFASHIYSAEKDAPLACTKENAQKWLARAEMYVKQSDPKSDHKPYLDIGLIYANTLLGNEARAKELLDSPQLQEKNLFSHARGFFVTALILKNRSIKEGCRFVDSLSVDANTKKDILKLSFAISLHHKQYKQCGALIAHSEKPQDLSFPKRKLIETYLKTNKLDDAKRLLKPVVAKDEDEKKQLDKLQSQMKFVESRAEQNKPMPQPTSRRLPTYAGLTNWVAGGKLPEGTSEEKTAYLANKADDKTKALAYRQIAEAMSSGTEAQLEAKKVCLKASLDATKKLPPEFTRYANLLLLAALYEEEGDTAQAKPLLREATDYLLEREKAIKERVKKEGEDNPISMLSNLAERIGMAPLACDLYIRLAEPDKAVQLAKTMNNIDLWDLLGKSAAKTTPASVIEKLFQNAPSPESKAAICSGVAIGIAEELYLKPDK